MSDVLMKQNPVPADAPQQPAATECRRQTDRIATSFSVTLVGQSAAGECFRLNAVSLVVSPGGASFALSTDISILEKLQPGQEVMVDTAFGELPGEINGLWTEPRPPVEGIPPRPCAGVKLLGGLTWMNPMN